MDHGSDWFGRAIEGENNPSGQPITDLNPPDEMNHYVQGGFYGHPFLVGNRVPRYEYMNRPDIVELAARTIPPAWPTGAHWAPNAMVFYTGEQFPQDYRGDAFVAYHGSWNRERKAGYCVTRVLFDQGRPVWRVGLRELPDEGGKGARPAGRCRRRPQRLAADQRRRRRPHLPAELPGPIAGHVLQPDEPNTRPSDAGHQQVSRERFTVLACDRPSPRTRRNSTARAKPG